MRNLSQYPVTLNEKLNLLQHYYEDAKKDQEDNAVYGDMTNVILSEIIEDVKRAKAKLVRYVGQ